MKIPCPDTGSKHEAASPTHSSGSAVSRVMRREPAGRSIGGPSGSRAATARARARVAPSARMKPSSSIEAERAHQIGIAHARRRCAGLSGSAAVYHQPSRKRLDQQPGAVVGRLLEQHDAADQPVEVLEPHAILARQHRAAPGRIDQEARRTRRAVVEAHAPRAVMRRGLGHLRDRRMRRALRRLAQQHRVEAGAVEPPADLMRLEQELVAQQFGPAPGAHGAIGRPMPIRRERLPHVRGARGSA